MTIINFIRHIANIRDSSDIERTIVEIEGNIALKGYNVWILVCAAMLASIGLDTNSTAVIIGAMLISPLMSPILGVGLAVGIHDNEMIKRSLRHLAMATVASLAASVLYFLLTPLGEATPEIIARTKPTLLDVMVALFGGIAGIVSSSRSDKTNAIPGVAIATALMPPLCTAGFGIATRNWAVFLGAFYLFFINAVFISLSTYLVVKYLRFPIKVYIDKSLQRKYARYAAITLSIIIIPSIYFLSNIYSETKTKQNIQNLVITPLKKLDNEVIKWNISPSDSIHQIKVYISGKEIPEQEKRYLQSLLDENGMKKYRLNIYKINISKDEIAEMSSEITQNLLKTIEFESRTEKQASPIERPKDPIDVGQLQKELKTLFPEVEQIGIGNFAYSSTQEDKTDTIYTILITKKGGKRSKENAKTLYDYLCLRLKKDTLTIIGN